MNISYGPPGASGVTQLMHVGQVELDRQPSDDLLRLARPAAIAAAGIWMYAIIAKKSKLRRTAFAASAGFAVVGILAR